MITVIRVYGRDITGFVAVIDDAGKISIFSDVTEFYIADILRSAGVEPKIEKAMSYSKFVRAYKKTIS